MLIKRYSFNSAKVYTSSFYMLQYMLLFILKLSNNYDFKKLKVDDENSHVFWV